MRKNHPQGYVAGSSNDRNVHTPPATEVSSQTAAQKV